MALGSSKKLADSPLTGESRELDLSILMQSASDTQRQSWDLFLSLLKQAVAARCDHMTIEPDSNCWRIRFFAADSNFEQIEYEFLELQRLTQTILSQTCLSDADNGLLHPLMASVNGKRYLIRLRHLQATTSVMLSVTIDPWQPMPSTLNDLQLPGSIDRKIRRWIGKPGAWLTIAGPSIQLNTKSQLAVIQAIAAPETRLLYVAREQPYSLPRISQIALHGIKEQHQEIIWQQALAMSFDVIALDSVNDRWLQPLTRLGDSVSSVINTIRADQTAQVMHRLQSLKLSSYRFVEGPTALLMQHPVRLQCEHCKVPDNPTPSQNAWLNSWLQPDNNIKNWIGANDDNFMLSSGCAECNQTGLDNWTTVYEWLEFNPEVSAAINDGHWQAATSLLQLQQTAVQSIFKLARQGSISLLEARRAIDPISHLH